MSSQTPNTSATDEFAAMTDKLLKAGKLL